MKSLITTALLCASVLLLKTNHASAQASIGIATPDASAMLDITATGKGLLIPRMPMANRPASPAIGLLIYQTDNTPGFYFYNGTAWTAVSGSGSSAAKDSIFMITPAVAPYIVSGAATGPYFFSPYPATSVVSVNQGYTASATTNGTNAQSGFVVPKALTITELRLAARVTPFSPAGSGSPNTTTITLFKNGSTTGLSVSVTTAVATGSTGSAVSTGTVSLAAGDIISYQYTQTNQEMATLYTVAMKGY